MSDENKRRGPQGMRVKLSGDWQTLIKKALKKQKPSEGFNAGVASKVKGKPKK